MSFHFVRLVIDRVLRLVAHNPPFRRDYLPELQRARKAKEDSLKAAKEDSLNRMLSDLAVDRQDPEFAARDTWNPEDEDEDDDDTDINIIDRSELLTIYLSPWSGI